MPPAASFAVTARMPPTVMFWAEVPTPTPRVTAVAEAALSLIVRLPVALVVPSTIALVLLIVGEPPVNVRFAPAAYALAPPKSATPVEDVRIEEVLLPVVIVPVWPAELIEPALAFIERL